MGGRVAFPFVGAERAGAIVPDTDTEVAARMAGLADDACVVAAGRQHEGQRAIIQQVQLEHRMPGRNVIALRPDDEHRQFDIAERERTARNLETTFCEIIVEK